MGGSPLRRVCITLTSEEDPSPDGGLNLGLIYSICKASMTSPKDDGVIGMEGRQN